MSTLAYVGAGATVLSLVASSVCGIGYTLAVQADESRVVDDELPWLIGFGVGAAGVVTGLVLMVVGAASGADEAPASAGDQSTPGPDSASVQP